jgi:hypothetical protein
MPAYFTGRGNDLGNVSRSPASNFTELVNMHIFQPIPLALSKATFDALDPAERDLKKRVAYLIAPTYPSSPHVRQNTNDMGVCNLLFLDIDPIKEKDPATKKFSYTGECPAAPFISNPEMLARQLHPFNFAAYVTASHTPQFPRLRIVVEAENIPPHRYPDAVCTVAKHLGIKFDRASLTVVQAMYLPVIFQDQGEDDHPLLTYVVPADNRGTRAFTEADISEQDARLTHSHSTRLPANPNALDLLRPPVDEVTLEVAREALSRIDPDCEYEDWWKVATGLKHNFPHQDEEAFQLFDEWSRGELSDSQLFSASKYEDVEKTRAKWDSFKPSPDNRLPVTVRTMLVKAVEGGWSAALVKDKCFERVMRWIKEEARSFSQLTTEGARRIATTPLMTIAEEDALLRAMVNVAKTKFETPVNVLALRKELMAVKKQLTEVDDEERKNKVPVWAKSWIFVSAQNEFFRHRTGERLGPEQFDNTFGCEMPLSEDFRPVIAPRAYLLNNLKCERVYDYDYNPSEPESIITKDGGKLYVNTYVRSYPEPRHEAKLTAGAIFYKHIMRLIAEPRYRTLLCDWIAYQVQFPGRKVLWAPIIQGAEGAGKTFIARAMATILGEQHVKTVDISAIKRGWNEWSAVAQLVVIEEIRVVGTNRHEVMSELKPLITNSSINVNERSRNSREARNRTNYILFTNFHDALALTAGDRRYFVIKSSLQTKAQVLALGTDYFKELFHMLETMGAGLRAYFESWQFSKEFDPMGHAPVTTYLEQLISDSASDDVAAVRRFISDGDSPLVAADLISTRALTDLLRSEEGMRDVSGQKVAHILRQEGYSQACRPMLNGIRHYLWVKGLTGTEDEIAEIARERMNNVAVPEII